MTNTCAAYSTIKNVLISDDVDNKCKQILENNGFNVVKNTGLKKEQLMEEVKVRIFII